MRSLFPVRPWSLLSLFFLVFASLIPMGATQANSDGFSSVRFVDTCEGVVATVVNSTDAPRDYEVMVVHDGTVRGGQFFATSIQPGQSWTSPPAGRRFSVDLTVYEDSLFTDRVTLGSKSWVIPPECPMAGGSTVVSWGPKLTKTNKRPTVTIKAVASSSRIGWSVKGATSPVWTSGLRRAPGVYVVKMPRVDPGKKFCFRMHADYSDGILSFQFVHAISTYKCYKRPRS